MLKALSTAATGLEAQQANIDNIANDIANVNTDGYKRATTEFQDLMYENERKVTAMTKRQIASLSFLILTFLASAFSQEDEISKASRREEARDLGKNYAINLVIEPGEDAAGITVMTADKHFMANANKESADGRMSLAFEGEIMPKGDDLVFVRYSLQAELRSTGKEMSQQQIALKGSILAKLDNKIVVAKSKDKSFTLKVTLAH